jgi:hypothetical protein
MRNIQFVLAGIGMALLLTAAPAIADTAAIRTLARMTMDLDHFPSEAEKAVLKGIINREKAALAALAGA